MEGHAAVLDMGAVRRLRKRRRRYCAVPQRFFDLLFGFGTFLPFLRASERAMAIACLRLFTVPPLPPLPLLRVPFLRRRMALLTFLLELREYPLAILRSVDGFVF